MDLDLDVVVDIQVPILALTGCSDIVDNLHLKNSVQVHVHVQVHVQVRVHV